MTLRLLSPAAFGARVVQLREARGWKQTELARRAGKTQPEVSRWERGGVAPTYDTVAMLADALGADVREFMEDDGRAETPPHSADEVVGDSFLEVLLREARAAESRANAAASWARWLELEARNREVAHQMLQEERAERGERRAARAGVIPTEPLTDEETSPTEEEKKRGLA